MSKEFQTTKNRVYTKIAVGRKDQQHMEKQITCRTFGDNRCKTAYDKFKNPAHLKYLENC